MSGACPDGVSRFLQTHGFSSPARDLPRARPMNKTEVVIRTPCGADWTRMDPRGSARFCGQCDKLVHDLSSMTEQAARRLLQSTSESLCVRYLHDATGTIWF